MNSREASKELLEEARLILEKDISSAEEAGNHRLVLRRSQEVVELVIKAFIKATGYEYPKIHDPSPLITRICQEKEIGLAMETIEIIQKASSTLAEERAPAFYAERSYTSNEAKEAKTSAEFVFKTLCKIIQQA
ncbi:unnamed protein product, partial [marine sediment metagenome]